MKFTFDTIDGQSNDYGGVFIDNLAFVEICEDPSCTKDADCDDGFGCTKWMPERCEKPGKLPEKCDRCHCSCSFVSAERKPFPVPVRKAKRSLRKIVPQQECPAGEEWDRCATSKCNNERKCGDEESFPVLQNFCRRAKVRCGEAGCVCEPGLVRDNRSGRCVPREYCDLD